MKEERERDREMKEEKERSGLTGTEIEGVRKEGETNVLDGSIT